MDTRRLPLQQLAPHELHVLHVPREQQGKDESGVLALDVLVPVPLVALPASLRGTLVAKVGTDHQVLGALLCHTDPTEQLCHIAGVFGSICALSVS